MATKKRAKRRPFGAIRELKSERFQASFVHPTQAGKRVNAPRTFEKRWLAERWLADQREAIDRGEWTPQTVRGDTEAPDVETFGREWLRTHRMAHSTRSLWSTRLRDHVFPFIGAVRLADITTPMIRAWHDERVAANAGRRSLEIAYTALSAMMSSAVEAGHLAANPCTLKNVYQASPDREPIALEIDEVQRLFEYLPARYRPMILVAGLCGLRWGEVVALRRRDVDVDALLIHVKTSISIKRRTEDEVPTVDESAGRRKAHFVRGKTKTPRSTRELDIPPHVGAILAAHLDRFTAVDPDALLFPAVQDEKRPLSRSTFDRWFRVARERANVSDELTFHALRHTAATTLAGTGLATLSDIMKILGHTTPRVAVRYQHVLKARSRAIAQAISDQAQQSRAIRDGRSIGSARTTTTG